MNLREAAQQALEALEGKRYTACGWRTDCDKAITALKAALEADDGMYGAKALTKAYENGWNAAKAEPVQEPVAWMVYTLDGKSVCVTDSPADFKAEHRALPLYTAPPKREPLTEEELSDVVSNETRGHLDRETYTYALVCMIARAMEREHGIWGEK